MNSRLLLLLFSVLSTPLLAEEESLSLDDALELFEPVEEVTTENDPSLPGEGVVAAEVESRRYSLRGHWLNGLSWNIGHSAPPSTGDEPDYRGLSRLSSKLWLELELPLQQGWRLHGESYLRHDFAYSLRGERRYSERLLDTYQNDFEVGELWLRGTLGKSLDLKLGRQVVVWGQSDYLRVNDTINPVDLREPGLGEIETLRLPLGMARADYYHGPWQFSALWIPEQRSNLAPPCNSDFSQQGGVEAGACNPLAEQFPADGFDQAEWGFSALGRFSGWDLSLYRARLNHDTPYLDDDTLRYARVNQWGAALNVAQGSWLWKGEVSYLDGLEYAAAGNRNRVDLLLGGEYRGVRDVTLTLEAVRRDIGDFIPQLETAPDSLLDPHWSAVLVYQHNFRNDTLQFKGVLARSGARLTAGGYSRVSLQYDINDDWTLSGGGIWYRNSGPLSQWGENDRLFMELRQDF